MKIKLYYPATYSYLLFIVLLNTIFSYVPDLHIWGEPVSAADFLVGLIYVMRDFAQRETKHWVILAMFAGCFISYLLAEKDAALASVGAFAVGEILDWCIYTYTKKPLSQRIIISSIISSPVDSAVNLYLLLQFNLVGLVIMTATKILGATLLWLYWHIRTPRAIRNELPDFMATPSSQTA
jgi:queuosine precursor transporter